jgi:hypothetical protein
MEFEKMKNNLSFLIESVEKEKENIYKVIIDNPTIVDIQNALLRYAEYDGVLNIYRTLYNIDDEKEFKKVLESYVQTTIDLLEKKLQENIELENYETCSLIKNEIKLIQKLL